MKDLTSYDIYLEAHEIEERGERIKFIKTVVKTAITIFALVGIVSVLACTAVFRQGDVLPWLWAYFATVALAGSITKIAFDNFEVKVGVYKKIPKKRLKAMLLFGGGALVSYGGFMGLVFTRYIVYSFVFVILGIGVVCAAAYFLSKMRKSEMREIIAKYTV